MYTLFTDTDCDVTPEMAAEYGYSLISMPYIENGKEVYPYESWPYFESHTFYNTLRKGTIPTTCGLSPEKYMSYFEPSFKEGSDIVYVHFSKAMSGTFNAMDLALEQLYRKYPGRKCYTIDTKGITTGSLNLAMDLGELHKKGASIQELLDYAKKEVDHYAIYFYADNLKFFAKSGRVNGITAAMGGLLGIRPLIFMDSDGVMKSIGKARGRVAALHKILGYIKDLGDDVAGHRIIIAHTDCPLLAKEMAAMLKDNFGSDLNIVYSIVNPVAGAHCGPDCVGVSFHAKHR
jgi:DegV family protein with EDD domain